MEDAKQHPQAYVAIGADGLLKVGFSRSAETRLVKLRQEFKAKGDELFRSHICARIHAAHSVEYGLIEFCRAAFEQHSGREWFKAGDFQRVVAEAERLTEDRKHIKPLPPLTEAERARIAERRRLREMWELQAKARRAEQLRRRELRLGPWYAKRDRPQRVVDQFISYALRSAIPEPEQKAEA